MTTPHRSPASAQQAAGDNTVAHPSRRDGAAPPTPRQGGAASITREAEAAASLRESIADLAKDDEALLLDSIEGETGLFECFDALLVRMADTRVHIAGLEAVIADLTERKRRFEARVETDRALIEQAMMIADLPKVERPLATLSLARRQPKVEVLEEASIPAEFWKAGDPKLDRKALAEALKDGRPVPGATLSNAAPSLSVRTR